MLTQPSLWLDEDVAAALRRAMDMKRIGQAERLIRGEAIRFMSQQQSASKEASLEMVLVDQPEEAPPAEPVPPSAPAPNMFDELWKKYGFKRPEPPVVVIAKPIPPSAPAPIPPPVSSKTRVKRTVRKKVAFSPSVPSSENEEESVATQSGEASQTRLPSTAKQLQKANKEIPPEVEVKL